MLLGILIGRKVPFDYHLVYEKTLSQNNTCFVCAHIQSGKQQCLQFVQSTFAELRPGYVYSTL